MSRKILIVLHGGESWNSQEEYTSFLKSDYTIAPFSPKEQGWKLGLRDSAYHLGYEVYCPELPSKINAHYEEWQIVLRRLFQQLIESASLEVDEITIVGHSLGGCLLLSYLASNEGVDLFDTLSAGVKKVQVHFVAACLQAGDFHGPISENDWNNLQSITKKYSVHAWHSVDDTIVPLSDFEVICKKLPGIHAHLFQDRFHFVGPNFPELAQIVLRNI